MLRVKDRNPAVEVLTVVLLALNAVDDKVIVLGDVAWTVRAVSVCRKGLEFESEIVIENRERESLEGGLKMFETEKEIVPVLEEVKPFEMVSCLVVVE